MNRHLAWSLASLLLAGCADPSPGFVESAGVTGLDFWHFSGATGEFFLPETTGSGVALLDFDNDGDLDVLLLQGAALGVGDPPRPALRPPPAGWRPGNRLFRNELVPDGRLRFIDVSADAGDLGGGYAMGAAVGDYDNDGDADVYLTGFADNYLLRNDGGRFTDVSARSGTTDPRWNVGAAFFDYDIDGDLDLYVAAYVGEALTSNRVCRNATDQRDYCSPSNFPSLPDRLFRNDGEDRFSDVSAAAGITAASGAGLGVLTADFDADGLVDVFVANDQTPNHLWRNRGDGTFAENGLLAGAAYNGDGRAEASMGVTAADFDMDGDLDLFMTHLSTETNTLYRNDGSGNFDDATDRANLGAGSIRYTGWGTSWFDVDLDGDLDLFVANGAVMAGLADGKDHVYAQRNQLYLAEGDGYREVSLDGEPRNSRGAAFGDLDNDGDIDAVVSNNDGPAAVWLNDSGGGRHWSLLRLRGERSSRDAYGARVALLRAGQSPVWRRVASDGSYAAANDARVHFGLGGDAAPVDIGVVWPDGRREIWRDVGVDRIVELVEGSGASWP